MNQNDILLIEDDHRLAQLTQQYLEKNGFSVSIESRGDRAVPRVLSEKPKLILLDIMLPGLDGLSVCRQIRKISDCPIIMLTAKDSDFDQVIGLEAGADDYVTKSSDPMVLLARIRVLLRRSEVNISPIDNMEDIILDDLHISPASQKVWLNQQTIPLTTQEFELLTLLARNAGTIMSRESLFRCTRGIDYNGLDRSIDVRISHLRKKLNDDVSSPYRIKTIWGKGYLLAIDAWKHNS